LLRVVAVGNLGGVWGKCFKCLIKETERRGREGTGGKEREKKKEKDIENTRKEAELREGLGKFLTGRILVRVSCGIWSG